MLFGTFYLPKNRQPEDFGVRGERVPENFFGQLAWPFRRKQLRAVQGRSIRLFETSDDLASAR